MLQETPDDTTAANKRPSEYNDQPTKKQNIEPPPTMKCDDILGSNNLNFNEFFNTDDSNVDIFSLSQDILEQFNPIGDYKVPLNNPSVFENNQITMNTATVIPHSSDTITDSSNTVTHSATMTTALPHSSDTEAHSSSTINVVSMPDKKCPVAALLDQSGNRLPEPCPIPTSFSRRVQQACLADDLSGLNRLAFVREAGMYYDGICPNPTPLEYTTMAKTLCNTFPQLRDKKPPNGEYWV